MELLDAAGPLRIGAEEAWSGDPVTNGVAVGTAALSFRLSLWFNI